MADKSLDESELQNGINGNSSEDEALSSTVNSDAPQEEEKTLTDHLNKRLLESFLSRLQEGAVRFPPNASPQPPPDNEQEDSFDTDK